MNNLERLSPADLEALWSFVYRQYQAGQKSIETALGAVRHGHKTTEWFNALPEHKEEDVFLEGLQKIRTVQLNQFHRIIVEGKPPKWDLETELNTKTGEMNVSHLPGEKPPTE